MMSELTLQQVSYRYPGGSRYALDGISGTFSAGKLYAVIGPSGSGKSTLLSLMAGLDRPTEGSLQLNGSDYRSLNLDRCRRQEIAMIFQAFQLFPLLTVLENVCFPMEANGVKQKEAKAKAKELLTSVGISEEQYQRYPANLSGGEQQRVAIARALSSGAGIILADEPTGNLDTANGNQVMEILLRLAHEEGRCVIVVTHDMDIAAQADAAAGQTTEKDAQPSAAAPQEPAKRQRLSGEELDALRQEALHAYEAKGYDLKKAEWDAGRALSFWTMTDCKRLIREAAKLQPKATSGAQDAAAQEQPEVQQSKESPAHDSTQSSSADTAPEPEQVQAFIPPYQTFTCPNDGSRITEEDCYDCKHRTGCPHWEAAPPADA